MYNPRDNADPKEAENIMYITTAIEVVPGDSLMSDFFSFLCRFYSDILTGEQRLNAMGLQHLYLGDLTLLTRAIRSLKNGTRLKHMAMLIEEVVLNAPWHRRSSIHYLVKI